MRLLLALLLVSGSAIAQQYPSKPVRIEQRDQVLDQQVDGVIARRRPGAAVAAQVVAQHLAARLEQRHLPVPHGEVVGDAGDERHPAIPSALHAIADAVQG